MGLKGELRASYEAGLSVFIHLLESQRDTWWAQATCPDVMQKTV